MNTTRLLQRIVSILLVHILIGFLPIKAMESPKMLRFFSFQSKRPENLFVVTLLFWKCNAETLRPYQYFSIPNFVGNYSTIFFQKLIKREVSFMIPKTQ